MKNYRYLGIGVGFGDLAGNSKDRARACDWLESPQQKKSVSEKAKLLEKAFHRLSKFLSFSHLFFYER